MRSRACVTLASARSNAHASAIALARVTAFLAGRDYVLPADVKSIFPDAARHRIARSVRAEVEEVSTDAVVAELLEATPLP